jgi:hypothetical protein
MTRLDAGLFRAFRSLSRKSTIISEFFFGIHVDSFNNTARTAETIRRFRKESFRILLAARLFLQKVS